MKKIKIKSYINVDSITETEAINLATAMIESIDSNITEEENILTKLYYIVPFLGKIFVIISESDRLDLGVASNILSNIAISNYPLVKLPAQIIEYKELIIKIGSGLTDIEIKNAAQAIADEAGNKLFPYKIPVVKVINYNNTNPSKLALPSIFNGNVFSIEGIAVGEVETITDGDVVQGLDIIATASNDLIISGEFLLNINNPLGNTTSNNFGGLPYNMATNPRYLVVGDDQYNSNRGAVIVYDIDGNYIRTIHNPKNTIGDYFGCSVSVNESDILAVGAFGDDTGGSGDGAIRLYDLNTGNLIKEIFGNSTNNIGKVVEITNDRLISAHVSREYIHIYNLNGGLIRKIDVGDDNFGYSMSSDGNYIAVGSPRYAQNNKGRVTIYDMDGNYIKQFTSYDFGNDREFGQFVKVHNGKLLVSGLYSSSNAQGFIEFFDIESGSRLFTKLSTLNGDHFGRAGDMNDEFIVIGAHRNVNDYGRLVIYDYDGNELKTISPNNPVNGLSLGMSVSVQGGIVYASTSKNTLQIFD